MVVSSVGFSMGVVMSGVSSSAVVRPRERMRFVAAGVLIAFVAALLAGPLGGPAAANGGPPDYDFVFICPNLVVSGFSEDLSESFESDAIPKGATVGITSLLGSLGFTTAGSPAGLGIGGCLREDDPDRLIDLEALTVTEETVEVPIIAFVAGVVELEIEYDGELVPWASIATNTEYVVFFGPEDGAPSLTWTPDITDGIVLAADLEDFFRGSSSISVGGFAVGGSQSGSVFVNLKDDVLPGEYTVTVRFILNVADIGPLVGTTTEVLTASETFTVLGDAPETPAGPGASVSCSSPSVGGTVSCTLTAVPEFDFVWQASTNPVFASGVVTTDASGSGEFSFAVPASALGLPVLVEVVAWTAATSIGVAGGPVPTTVPAGQGEGAPVGVFVLLMLAATGLLVVSAGVALRPVGSVGGRR